MKFPGLGLSELLRRVVHPRASPIAVIDLARPGSHPAKGTSKEAAFVGLPVLSDTERLRVGRAIAFKRIGLAELSAGWVFEMILRG